MRFGIRIPSLRKRIAARTSWKRYVRHSLGFKAPRGWGWLTNPRRAAYNRIYRWTTVGVGKGRLLVVAHIRPLLVMEEAQLRTVPACLSVFRISTDGMLDFVRKYDVDVGNNTMFWMGMVPL